MPEDVQQAMLALHQNALMVSWADSQEKKRLKDETKPPTS